MLALAEPDARLIFSCGWHITLDGKDRYDFKTALIMKFFIFIAWVSSRA